MKSGETAPIPYMRALFTSTHLGSLLVASELLTGQCLAFVALALAGAAFQLLLPLLSKLCFRGPGQTSTLPFRWKWPLCLLCLVHGGIVLWVAATYIHATFLPHTPIWALLLLMLLVPLYSLGRSDAAIMRLSRLIFPVTILLIFLVLFYQTQWSSLPGTLQSLPWSEANALPRQGLLLLFLIFLNPVVATPLIFPDIPKKDFLTSQRQAALLSSLLIGLMLLMPVTTLGIPLFKALPHPLYAAANIVVHGTPLLRVDTLLSTVLAFSTFTDLVLCAQSLRVTLRAWHQTKSGPSQPASE